MKVRVSPDTTSIATAPILSDEKIDTRVQKWYEKCTSVNVIVLVPAIFLICSSIGAIWITEAVAGSVGLNQVKGKLENSVSNELQVTVQSVYNLMSMGLVQLEMRLLTEFDSGKDFLSWSPSKKQKFSDALLEMLYTNRKIISNCNFAIVDTKTLEMKATVFWEFHNNWYGVLTYYGGPTISIDLYTIENVNEHFSNATSLVPYQTANIPAASINLLGTTFLKDVRDAITPRDIIISAVPIPSVQDMTTGVGVRLYQNEETFGLLTGLFYANSNLKSLLMEKNPTKEGFIVVFQDDGVIIGDSYPDTDFGGVKFCNTTKPLIQQLCDKIMHTGGFDKESIHIEHYKTNHIKGFHSGSLAVHSRTVKLTAGHRIHLLIVIHTSEYTLTSARSYIISSALSAFVLITTIISMVAIIYPISRRLSSISKGFLRIQHLDLEHKSIKSSWLETSPAYELRVLNDNYESMVSTLASFSKYVSPIVVKNLVASKKEAKLKLEKHANCVIFFMDIADFTTLGETLTPEDLVWLTSQAFEGCSNIITSNGGIIDKYIGDCIMAFWKMDAENNENTIEYLACKSAIGCIEFIETMNQSWNQKQFPEIRCRIGVHAGPVLMGNFGSENRFDFTVIGDSVNTASRIEGLNKEYETTILVSQTIFDVVNYRDEFLFRPMDVVKLKGKSKPLLIYELKMPKRMAPTHLIDDYLKFSEGHAHFVLGDFAAASHYFSAIQCKDPATVNKLTHCNKLIAQGVQGSWDGVKVMYNK